MNPDNYASIEASKRLVEAGIVLKTERSWAIYHSGNSKICYTKDIGPFLKGNNEVYYPAPSPAEVWRELPEFIIIAGERYRLQLLKYRAQYFSYKKETSAKSIFTTISIVDALIDLLIWMTKETKLWRTS